MNIPIEALAQLVGGSPQFMLELTDDQQKKLRRFIHKRVLNPEDADDILQLTYLEAWRNRERFSGQATLSTWMCGIAQNLIRNHFRRMYAKPVHCEFDESLWHGQEENNNLDWEFEVNRRLEKTLSAIDHLPTEMRRTLYASLETDGSYQDTADVLDDVVVTASPFGVSQRASNIATAVIDEQALAVAPAQSLGDMLAGQPGLRSTGFAPGASRPVIRGLSGPRVQVLTNGIGMIDASSVSPDHAVATDPAEASRIEVVRGPSTLIYGGSAIGGVVNIIDSRIPTEIPAGGLSGVVSTQASSVDDGRSVFARLTAGTGHFAFNIDGVKRSTDDYDIPTAARSARLAAQDGEPRGAGGKQPNSYTELEAWGDGGAYIFDKGYFGVSY